MAERLKSWFVDQIARNLKLPHKGFFGWITCKYLEKRNSFLEINAVRLSNIKPDHKVLEIGFGSGLGLEAAYNIVKGGKGKVFGVEPSFYMVENAAKRLQKGVNDKKVLLFHADASSIPLNTDSVHRVFHCNCYYFWPSMRSAMREIYRVMQPGGIMVTTLSLENLKKSQEHGLLKFGHADPVKYMKCLENYGFENVHIEYHTDPQTGKQFQAIFSEVVEKPAHEVTMDTDDEDDLETEIRLMQNLEPERPQSTKMQTMENTVSELRKRFDIVRETEKS